MPAVTDRITERAECWFEFSRSTKDTLANGLQVITDPDDERWETELAGKRGGAFGYLSCRVVKRVDGEVHRSDLKTGEYRNAKSAREKMRRFYELVAEGSKTPWDQERHFRDLEEQAKKAERDGRERDLAVITGALKSALAGGGSPGNGGGA